MLQMSSRAPDFMTKRSSRLAVLQFIVQCIFTPAKNLCLCNHILTTHSHNDTHNQRFYVYELMCLCPIHCTACSWCPKTFLCYLCFVTQLQLTLLRDYGYGILVCIALHSDMSNHHYASSIIPYPSIHGKSMENQVNKCMEYFAKF